MTIWLYFIHVHCLLECVFIYFSDCVLCMLLLTLILFPRQKSSPIEMFSFEHQIAISQFIPFSFSFTLFVHLSYPHLFSLKKMEKKYDFCVEINSWNWKSTMNFKFIFMMHFCIVYLIANEWRHGNNVPLDDWQWEKVAHKKSKLFGYNLLSGPQKARFDVQTERQRDKQTNTGLFAYLFEVIKYLNGSNLFDISQLLWQYEFSAATMTTNATRSKTSDHKFSELMLLDHSWFSRPLVIFGQNISKFAGKNYHLHLPPIF